MRWSPTIAALADRVVAGMEATGDGDFNSLHLRIEKDARDWAAIMGGVEVPFSRPPFRASLAQLKQGCRLDMVLHKAPACLALASGLSRGERGTLAGNCFRRWRLQGCRNLASCSPVGRQWAAL